MPQVDYFVFGNSIVKILISFLWAALFRFSGFTFKNLNVIEVWEANIIKQKQ